jgi:MFS superfamily sulfate permease-like transporter
MERQLMSHAIRFNRQEWAGAFGDIGTDFPLIVALILAAGLHTPSVLIVFGLMQVLSGLIYRMPMPVQPLKAMATLVIAQKIAGPVLLGAGLAIGAVMLLLSVAGLLDKVAQYVPRSVVRGLQFGLGLSLCGLAFREYIGADQLAGYVLAGAGFILIIVLMHNKKYPASLAVILLGVIYAVLFKLDFTMLPSAFGLNLPQTILPTWEDITRGFVLLTLPQLPLSLANSILATRQVAEDLFPERNDITIRRIGLTYGAMNLIVPLLNGIPCCHGAGGMVGHYVFGGRTGGSVIIYGMLYLMLGLFAGDGFQQLVHIFPLPLLGVILVFEGLALMALIRDTVSSKGDFQVALLTGIMAFGLPYGFAIALLTGMVVHHAASGLRKDRDDK